MHAYAHAFQGTIMAKRKKSKDQITDAIINELSEYFGLGHPHAKALITDWLDKKWHPVEPGHFACSMDYKHPKPSSLDWVETGRIYIVLSNSAHAGLKIWISGKPIKSDVIDQAWQDKLSHLPQSKINEILEAPSLINLADYEAKEDDENTSIYTHEDG